MSSSNFWTCEPKVYSLWLEHVLSKYLPQDLLPEIAARFNISDGPTAIRLGPQLPNLQQYCLRSLARQLNRSPGSWLTSDDAKEALGPAWRMALLLQYTLTGQVSWLSIRRMFLGHHTSEQSLASLRADGGDTDAADWMDEEDDDGTHGVLQLPVLDLSFSHLRPGEWWPLRRTLNTRETYANLTAVSLAGSDLTIREAAWLLTPAGSGKVLRLRQLSLAGLSSSSGRATNEAIDILKKLGDTLEVRQVVSNAFCDI